MKRVITGTGRCGTSFLMHLLTNIGANTGYTQERAKIEISRIDGLNAGIEHALHWKITHESEWIKNPEWIIPSKFDELANKFDVLKVYIPLRNLVATGQSREYMTKVTHAGYGGLWMGANNAKEQEDVNARLFYNFINHLEDRGFIYTVISFEKMMQKPHYLYQKLGLTCDFEMFEKEYYNILDPEKIRF